MDRVAKSEELFKSGYNCSQSVIGAVCEDLGLDFGTAVKISEGFGGGMGRMRLTCGAVSAMVMAVGMLMSRGDTDGDTRAQVYAKVHELADEFKEQAASFVATEDGSVGTKGNVIDAIKENALEADVIYACGPMPMLRALKAYAAEYDMDCFVSMEERMACGIGACLACVCKTKDKDAHSNVNNKRICKEGPVFDAKEVEL